MACHDCAKARKRLKTAVQSGDVPGTVGAVTDGLYIITHKIKGMVTHAVTSTPPEPPEPPAPTTP